MTSASMTIVKYGETVTNVSASFPEATIGLCSIPSRASLLTLSDAMRQQGWSMNI